MRRWSRAVSLNEHEAWPPSPHPAETELDRAVRLDEEKEAKRVSDAIDHDIELEKQKVHVRQRNETRVLLLGQTESGKSTMLKNFQLHFAPEAFHAERDAWRAVIHLNLIRSVNFILDLLSPERVQDLDDTNTAVPSSPSGDPLRPLRMRLSPLRQVEMILAQQLSAHDSLHSPWKLETAAPGNYGRASEVSVRGGTGWKSLLQRRRSMRPTQARHNELDTAKQILHACMDDVVGLWANPTVQAGLKQEGVALQEQSGFFLDEASRIASAEYEPTDHDILKARVQTIGVDEHRLPVDKSGDSSRCWVFYDVGGVRGQRAKWVPYFEDVNAILFLCPVSAFNEVLLEDSTVNRLLDSFDLWKTICTSRLLASTTFVLLLNKCDILRSKLESGISFARYVRSYREAENDFDHVSEYLKRKFVTLHAHHTSTARQLHVYFTCAIDIMTTSIVIARIADAIPVKNLVSSHII